MIVQGHKISNKEEIWIPNPWLLFQWYFCHFPIWQQMRSTWHRHFRDELSSVWIFTEVEFKKKLFELCLISNFLQGLLKRYHAKYAILTEKISTKQGVCWPVLNSAAPSGWECWLIVVIAYLHDQFQATNMMLSRWQNSLKILKISFKSWWQVRFRAPLEPTFFSPERKLTWTLTC